MIRLAAMADLSAIEAMVLRFWRTTGAPVETDAYSRGHFAATLSALIEAPTGFAVVLDRDGPRGVILALVSISPFAPVKVADELIWWVEPEHRGGGWGAQLFKSYEDWAVGQGVAMVGASCFDDATAAWLAQQGYHPLDRKHGRPV